MPYPRFDTGALPLPSKKKKKKITLLVAASAFFVFIVSSLFCAVCKGNLFPEVNIEGNNFEEVAAVSDKHCQMMCTVHPRCTYFSFDR